MKKLRLVSGIALSLLSASAFAGLTLNSPGFKNNSFLPVKYAYCQANGKGGIKSAGDTSPALEWSGAPAGTKSFAVITTDPDIPNSPNFDLKGKVVPKNAQRITGYHWLLVNIPVSRTSLPEGAGSKGFVVGGKPTGITPYGLTGINVYTGVFASPLAKRIMLTKASPEKYKGTYGDYDGGCPPWNGLVLHHYTYTVYALDVAKLKLPESGQFHGPDVMKAMKGHVLAKAVLVAPYATNPSLIKK